MNMHIPTASSARAAEGFTMPAASEYAVELSALAVELAAGGAEELELAAWEGAPGAEGDDTSRRTAAKASSGNAVTTSPSGLYTAFHATE